MLAIAEMSVLVHVASAYQVYSHVGLIRLQHEIGGMIATATCCCNG
jgi:hypothetical protein